MLWHLLAFRAHQDECIKATIKWTKRMSLGEGGGHHSDPLQLTRGGKTFQHSAAPSWVHKTHSCILPELACDVTKSRITAKVIWASLILRFTFHLIWVSMAARDIRGKWIQFFNVEQLIRLATTSGQDNTKSQKSQRKRKKGEGGCIVISQAAIRVCMVCVPPASWRMVTRLSSSAPLLSALLNCAAALRVRSGVLPPSFRRHVKPLQVQRGNTHK